jgi:hypothetical protein
MFLDLLKEFWALLVGLISLVAWAVRVEVKGVNNATEIVDIKKQRAEDLEAAAAQRSADLAVAAAQRHADLNAAAEARDATSKRLDEIFEQNRETNRDIKDILGRLPR